MRAYKEGACFDAHVGVGGHAAPPSSTFVPEFPIPRRHHSHTLKISLFNNTALRGAQESSTSSLMPRSNVMNANVCYDTYYKKFASP